MLQAPDIAKGTVEYARRRYLAIGALVVFLLALLGEIPGVAPGVTAAGHLAVMLYVFFLSQVITRDRLLDLNEFIGRMLILSILAILFATISAALIGLGNNQVARLFNAIVGVIILLTLYEPLKERLESKVIELFFGERHRFAQVLNDLGIRMQHGVLDPSRMAWIVVDTLHDARRVTHVAVYLLEPSGTGFVRHAFRGPQPALYVNANELPTLWHAILKTRAPMIVEQLAEEQEDDEATQKALIDALKMVSADYLFPFVSGEEVLGFLTLRDDRTVDPYSYKEVAHLTKIAETASTVIWNSKLAERLRERERLAAIGAMAAGLAHEIRNPLGAIKGAAEYLDPKEGGPVDVELLEVIVEEVNRLNTVVSQFLDYARPFRARFQDTDLNEVVKRTAKLVEAQRETNPDQIALDLDTSVPTIEADTEQIKQVILNLVLNAIDASRESSEAVKIQTRYLSSRRTVEIRVVDRGVGIPSEDLEQIFIPFFTTKQHGTGLGLAVCQRIVMNHGGTIHPESEIGRGTDFIIQLPLQQRPESTLPAQIPSSNPRRSPLS